MFYGIIRLWVPSGKRSTDVGRVGAVGMVGAVMVVTVAGERLKPLELFTLTVPVSARSPA